MTKVRRYLVSSVATAFVLAAGLACSKHQADPQEVLGAVHFSPASVVRGSEHLTADIVNAYFVLPKPPKGEDPQVTMTSPFQATADMPDGIAGFIPFASFKGRHPTSAEANCDVTAWYKADGFTEFAVPSRGDSKTSTIAWNPENEVGVLVTVGCHTW